MNKRIIITGLITILVGGIIILASMTDKLYESVNTYYQIYLNGHKIGVLDNKDQLYELIDNNQVAIKSEYNVNNVYPPTDLKIVETNTYSTKLDDTKEVYKKLEEEDDFTIKGYVVTINGENKNFSVNVLDKEMFYNAAKRFVRAFLDEEEYENYINDNQEEIVETGRIIESMSFLENISIKESYISVNDKIYTDELELAHFLLFGSDPETKNYTVKLGDTIESISEDNELNVEEFLIANTNYKNEDAILRVGDTVNVTLIEPQLTFVYDLYEISDEEVYFDKKTVTDKSKPVGFSEVTTAGQNGLDRTTEKYSVTNGVRSQEVQVIDRVTIREVVDQVTTKGPRYSGGGISGVQNPVTLDGAWGWPTNKGYVITSYRGWRWGKLHQGIDISGAGNFGSPIYAVADGVVTYAFNGCPSRGRGYGDSCGGQLGNQIMIDHQNGYVTRYGHLHQTIKVRVGQTVQKGDIIGYMGNSGSSTGVHLHYEALRGGSNINPLDLYR